MVGQMLGHQRGCLGATILMVVPSPRTLGGIDGGLGKEEEKQISTLFLHHRRWVYSLYICSCRIDGVGAHI